MREGKWFGVEVLFTAEQSGPRPGVPIEQVSPEKNQPFEEESPGF